METYHAYQRENESRVYHARAAVSFSRPSIVRMRASKMPVDYEYANKYKSKVHICSGISIQIIFMRLPRILAQFTQQGEASYSAQFLSALLCVKEG